MKFSKLQATGNDFILVDARGVSRDWAALARDACQRHFGIGADGLILVQNSQVADVKMRIFNSDGSEAEACGNGLRCIVKYAVERGIASPPQGEKISAASSQVRSLTVETLPGIRQARAHISKGKVNRAEVGMGKPFFLPEQVPVEVEAGQGPILGYPLVVGDRELRLSILSMGNPHAVCFISGPVAQFPLAEVGPEVEKHPIFPRRTNFEIARVLSEDEIEARVWERGVGETMACGSGACAIAVAAQLLGHAGSEVNIRLPGGELKLCWDGKGEVLLGGPVEEVFVGEWC